MLFELISPRCWGKKRLSVSPLEFADQQSITQIAWQQSLLITTIEAIFDSTTIQSLSLSAYMKPNQSVDFGNEFL